MRFKWILLLGLVLGASACSSTNSPARPMSQSAQIAGEYTLQKGDRVRIRIWPDSSLGGDYPVEEDGKVYLPVIGAMTVEGLPLHQLRRELRAQYGEAMKEPTVSVTPLFRVSVLGAVQRPGLYEADPTQTVVDAISMAGGFSPTARQNRVQLQRSGYVLELSPTAQPEGVWALRSGDRIVVPQKWGFNARDILYVLQSLVLAVTLYRQTRSD